MNRAARIALPAVIGLLPVGAVLTPTSLVPLAVAGALALLSDSGVRGRFAEMLRSPLSRTIAALLVWAAVSCVWAPHPGGSVVLVIQVAAVMAAGGVLIAAVSCLDDVTRKRAIGAIAIAGPILLFLAASELIDRGILAHAIRGWPEVFVYNPVRYDRGAAIAAIIAWPTVLVLSRRVRPSAAIVFAILTLVLLFLLQMAAARLAFAVGGFVYLISLWKPRAVLNILTVGMVAAILLAPPVLIAAGAVQNLPVVADELPKTAPSERHRLLIAQFALAHIAERPLFGHGFDSSRAIPGGKAEKFENAPALPLHPHNAILQVWLELGAVGAVITAAIVTLILCGMRAFSADRGSAAGANATVAAFATIALLSYGIWQNWWLMTGWFAAMLVLAAAQARPTDDQFEM